METLSPDPNLLQESAASRIKTGDVVGTPLAGYWGIWYSNQPSDDEFKFKYSGGLGTYCAKHIPLAYYCSEVNRTFFVYGGSLCEKNELAHMISYYDHSTGMVPKPTMLVNKETDDAHDNPVLTVDSEGYLWVFSSSHGTSRPSFLFRSQHPYSIDKFECRWVTNFSYPQPWNIGNRGACFLFTKYIRSCRNLFCYPWSAEEMRQNKGEMWEGRRPIHLASIKRGHYQISGKYDDPGSDRVKVGTAFNVHPRKGGLNARTNLYYLESWDGGLTWQTVTGGAIKIPLRKVKNPALIWNFHRRRELIYLKDINFDQMGNPVILAIRSKDFHSGPQEFHRTWAIIRWTGSKWVVSPETMERRVRASMPGPPTGVITSDSNYDVGCLHTGDSEKWQILAPTDPGPQPYNPGGEMVLWVSYDKGAAWHKERVVTRESGMNHTYARRPVNAHPDFFALWADGNPRRVSPSRLYFCDHTGKKVHRLPSMMKSDFEEPASL